MTAAQVRGDDRRRARRRRSSGLVSALTAATLIHAAAAAGCTKEGSPGSCFRDRDNACVEYGRAQAAAGERLCSGRRWTQGEKSCPARGRLGACVKQGATELLYEGAPNHYTPLTAKSACEWGGGVFTPAPP